MNLKLRTHNSELRTHNATLRTLLIILLIIIFQLYTPNSKLNTPNSELLYAQDKLTVDGDLEINSTAATQRHGLILRPQAEPAPASSFEGQIYYDEPTNQPRYYDGTWRSFGQDLNVATRIVAASNSLRSVIPGTTTPCPGDGSPCENPKASLTETGPIINLTCDGTADQEIIQSAIDDIGSKSGVIYLLEGTYNISGSINLNNTAPLDSGKAIIGAGAGTVLRVVTGASNVNVIDASGVNRILISQLRIDGNRSVTGIDNKGIRFSNVTYSKIDKVWVENMSDDGINLDPNADNNIISNNSILSNGDDGVDVTSSSNNAIFGNSVQSNVNDGIDIETNANNNDVSGNICWSNGSSGIDLDANLNNVITGNISWSNRDNGIDLAGVSGSNPVDNTVISGNIFYSNTYYGIKVNCSNNNTVTGNNVSSNGSYGIYLKADCPNNPSCSNNIVSGNVVRNNGMTRSDAEGIKINDNSDNNVISSNLLSDSSGTGYPIEIDNTNSDNNYLVGNLISTWPAGYNTISDLGTNTRYTTKEKITLERATILTVSSSTITLPSPISYLPVVSSGYQVNVTTITAGKAIGDQLILEGTNNSRTVQIQTGGNVKLNVAESNCTLGLDDTLTLIWSDPNWIELHRANNSP